jgi:hypothetical protein
LAHAFEHKTLWWWEYVAKEVCHLMADWKQRVRKGLGTKYNLQRHIPSKPLPASRSYILKFAEPPKIVPLIGDQALKT